MSSALLTRVQAQARLHQWVAVRAADSVRMMHTRTCSMVALNALARGVAASNGATRVAAMRMPLHATHVRRFARKFGDDDAGQQQQQQQQQQSGKQENQEKTEEDGEKPAEEGNAYLGLVIIACVIGGVVYWVVSEPTPKSDVEEDPFYMVYGDSPLLPAETLDAVGRRPRTVVLGFDHALVHCSWSRLGGWEVRKRPGVDRLIERLHLAGYELVLWANLPSFEVEPTLAELDPLGYFKHKLYNESTNLKYSQWKLVKDLSRLQRDPKRLIVLDVSAEKYAPIGEFENVMTIKPFVDDINDRELTKVLKVLEDVKRYNIHDLTSVVHRFNANPEEDLFAKEREAAELAAQNLRHGGSAKKANSKSAKEDAEDKPAAAAKQSWGAWIKGKIYGQ